MTTDYRALCAELTEELHEHTCLYEGHESELVARARALVDQPEPEGPTDQELLHLYQVATPCYTVEEYKRELDFARAVLSRWGHPTPQPVPVSERLPGPEDCDAEGRCWLGGHQMGGGTPTWLLGSWLLGYPAWAERFPDVHRFWLPANALPTLEANV